MNQTMQSTTPAGATSKQEWMLRIQAALKGGQKPAYDDLEEAVHSLLSERAGLCWLAAEAETAFDFIDQDLEISDVKADVVCISLKLDLAVFTREGVRGAIAGKIAALQAARGISVPREKEAEPALN